MSRKRDGISVWLIEYNVGEEAAEKEKQQQMKVTQKSELGKAIFCACNRQAPAQGH